MLNDALTRSLRALKVDCEVSTAPMFGDLVWDADMSLPEVLALEPALIVDSTAGTGQIVVRQVRAEIRYWLTSNRHDAKENELGVVETLENAIALSTELLAVADLRTPRLVGGARRGRLR